MKIEHCLVLNKSGKPIGKRDVEVYGDEPPYFRVCRINGKEYLVFPKKQSDINEGA